MFLSPGLHEGRSDPGRENDFGVGALREVIEMPDALSERDLKDSSLFDVRAWKVRQFDLGRSSSEKEMIGVET